MTKAELISSIAENTGVDHGDTRKVIECFISTVRSALERNEKVTLYRFGEFKIRNYPARAGHDPRSGEKILVAGSKVVKFKPSTSLKSYLN